jgi:hypothetical protein
VPPPSPDKSTTLWLSAASLPGKRAPSWPGTIRPVADAVRYRCVAGAVISGRTLAAMARRTVITRWLQPAYDVVIAVLVAVATTRSNTEYDPYIGLTMAAALLWRRRRPAAVMVTVSGLALVQYLLVTLPARPLADRPPAAYDVAVLIAMVAVVSHADHVWQAYAAGGVAMIGVVIGDPDEAGSSRLRWRRSG